MISKFSKFRKHLNYIQLLKCFIQAYSQIVMSDNCN